MKVGRENLTQTILVLLTTVKTVNVKLKKKMMVQ